MRCSPMCWAFLGRLSMLLWFVHARHIWIKFALQSLVFILNDSYVHANSSLVCEALRTFTKNLLFYKWQWFDLPLNVLWTDRCWGRRTSVSSTQRCVCVGFSQNFVFTTNSSVARNVYEWMGSLSCSTHFLSDAIEFMQMEMCSHKKWEK